MYVGGYRPPYITYYRTRGYVQDSSFRIQSVKFKLLFLRRFLIMYTAPNQRIINVSKDTPAKGTRKPFAAIFLEYIEAASKNL